MGLASLQDHFLNPLALHSWISHFPVALWSLGALMYAVSFTSRFAFLRPTALINGVLGSLFGWVAIESGRKAILGLDALDPELKSHRHLAETSFVFFSVGWGVAALAYLVRERFFPGRQIPTWMQGSFGVAFVLGLAFLLLSGERAYEVAHLLGERALLIRAR